MKIIRRITWASERSESWSLVNSWSGFIKEYGGCGSYGWLQGLEASLCWKSSRSWAEARIKASYHFRTWSRGWSRSWYSSWIY